MTDESVGALANRVARAATATHKPITLLFGTGLTREAVPDVGRVLDLIEQGLETEASEAPLRRLRALRADRSDAVAYQEAPVLLTQFIGRKSFNGYVQQAVLQALTDEGRRQWDVGVRPTDPGIDEQLGVHLESNPNYWTLPPAVLSLGRLLTRRGDAFGRRVLTTNFDPLIGVGVRAAGGVPHPFRHDADGDIAAPVQTAGVVSIAHLHGYWWGRMLHTPRQLTMHRDQLIASLSRLLAHSVVVVVGYGGWDDAFTHALDRAAAADDDENVEVLWAFYDQRDEVDGTGQAQRVPDAECVTRYYGVDVTAFLTELEARLLPPSPAPRVVLTRPAPTGVVAPSRTPAEEFLADLDDRFRFSWRRSSEGMSPSVLFWPVRLRTPQLVHCVQTHVAAALARHGLRVVLCIDDLGVDSNRRIFDAAIDRWYDAVNPGGRDQLERVSLADYMYERDRAGLDTPDRLATHPWQVMQQWLARGSLPSVESVLAAAKVAEPGLSGDRLRERLRERRGMRLLTPPMIWARLNYELTRVPAEAVLTLGGIDERPMWETYDSIIRHGVSHLYTPRVHDFRADGSGLRWTDAESFRRTLQASVRDEGWREDDLLPWTLTSVILLRQHIAARPARLVIAGRVVTRWRDLEDLFRVQPAATLDALAEAVGAVFLSTDVP